MSVPSASVFESGSMEKIPSFQEPKQQRDVVENSDDGALRALSRGVSGPGKALSTGGVSPLPRAKR